MSAIRRPSPAAGSSSAGSSDGGREDLWGADEGLADESSESDPPSRVLMSGSQPTRGKGPTLEHNDVEEHMLQLPQSPRRQATEIASAGGAVRRNGGLAMRTNSGIPVRISEQGRGDRNTDVHAVGRSAAHVGHETLAVAVGWSRGLESLLQESHDAALADVPCAAPRFLSDSDQAQFNNGGHALRKDHLSHGAEPANLPNRSPFRGIFLSTFPLIFFFSVTIHLFENGHNLSIVTILVGSSRSGSYSPRIKKMSMAPAIRVTPVVLIARV